MSKELLQAVAQEIVVAQQATKRATDKMLAIHPLTQETEPYRELLAIQVRLNEVMTKVLRLRV